MAPPPPPRVPGLTPPRGFEPPALPEEAPLAEGLAGPTIPTGSLAANATGGLLSPAGLSAATVGSFPSKPVGNPWLSSLPLAGILRRMVDGVAKRSALVRRSEAGVLAPVSPSPTPRRGLAAKAAGTNPSVNMLRWMPRPIDSISATRISSVVSRRLARTSARMSIAMVVMVRRCTPTFASLQM